jgi:hypothetical protein
MIKSTLQAGQVWTLATLVTLLLVPLAVIYILETSFMFLKLAKVIFC